MAITLTDIKDKYDLHDYKEFPITIPDLTDKSGIILLVGSSGSGKSSIINAYFGDNTEPQINHKVSVIENFSSVEKGEKLLLSFGLRTIPAWFRPFNTLSNGEYHRAVSALAVDQGIQVIDEFTSVVDRDTAKSLSVAIRKAHDKGIIDNIVLASCHFDIIEWLQPDVIYNTDRCEFVPRGNLQRPKITLQIYSSSVEDWVLFKKYHYLDGDISKSCHCYTAYMDEKPVGFVAVIHGTGRDIRSYWRESRLVILPEFQGLGLGVALSEAIAEEYVSRGLRYFSKTAHPALGEHRDKSNKWRNTSTNHKKRKSYLKKDGSPRISVGYGKTAKAIMRDFNRVCYSHEYIGEIND